MCIRDSYNPNGTILWSFLISLWVITSLLSFPDTLSAVTSTSSGFNFRWSSPYFPKLCWDYDIEITFLWWNTSTRYPFTHQPWTSSIIQRSNAVSSTHLLLQLRILQSYAIWFYNMKKIFFMKCIGHSIPPASTIITNLPYEQNIKFMIFNDGHHKKKQSLKELPWSFLYLSIRCMASPSFNWLQLIIF